MNEAGERGTHQPRVKYVLELFSKHDEACVDVFEIRGMALSDLQRLLGEPSTEPLYDCFPIEPAHVSKLEEATGVQIDLANVDGFVSGEALSSE